VRWSKLKKLMEARFAPSVAGRVELFVTRYKGEEEDVGRWAVRFDGREVEGLSERTARWRRELLQAAGRSTDEAQAVQIGEGTHNLPQFYRGLEEYLNLSIDEALASPDVLIRSLALLDRRTGKRRLRQFSFAGLHPLEAACLAFRRRAEHIRDERPAGQGRRNADEPPANEDLRRE
jgi:hypothetical protein